MIKWLMLKRLLPTYFGPNPSPHSEWQQFAAPPCFWDIGLSPRALFARHHHHWWTVVKMPCQSLPMNIWWDLDPEQWDRVDQPSFLRPSDRFPPAASAGDGSRGGQSTNLIGLLRKGQDTWQPPQWGSHIMELGIPYFQSFLSQTSSDCIRCLKITEWGLIQLCERSELRLHFEWTKVD